MHFLRKLSTMSVLMAWFLAACAQSTAQNTSLGAPLPTASPGGTQAQQDASSQPGCTVVTRQPTPGPTEQALLPPAGEKDWIKGPEAAYITLVEYSDFQ